MKIVQFSKIFACVLLFLAFGCDDKEKDKEKEPEEIYNVSTSPINLLVGGEHQVVTSPSADKFQWSSENNSVATVSATGLVKAIGVGQTNIVAAHGSETKKIPVTVTAEIVIVPVAGATVKPGKERVLFKFDVQDAGIKTIRIARSGSTSVDVDVNNQTGTFESFFEGLPEGTNTFTFTSLDGSDNESEPQTITGDVYGTTYQATVDATEIVKSITVLGNGAIIAWSNADCYAHDLSYKDADGNNVSRRFFELPAVNAKTNLSATTLIGYRADFVLKTLFLPDPTCVDTFYVETTSVTNKKSTLSASAPCEILGANFDLGGKEVAFWDNGWNAPNDGNYYRRDMGDAHSDSIALKFNATVGIFIGDNAQYEWQHHTVTVLDAGDYEFDILAAVPNSNGRYRWYVDGTMVLNDMPLTTATPNWSTFVYHFEHHINAGTEGITAKPIINLTAGEHVLRFNVLTAGFDFVGFKFTKK